MAKVLDKQEVTVNLTEAEVKKALIGAAEGAYWRLWGKDCNAVTILPDGTATLVFLRKEEDFDTEKPKVEEEAAA